VLRAFTPSKYQRSDLHLVENEALDELRYPERDAIGELPNTLASLQLEKPPSLTRRTDRPMYRGKAKLLTDQAAMIGSSLPNKQLAPKLP